MLILLINAKMPTFFFFWGGGGGGGPGEDIKEAMIRPYRYVSYSEYFCYHIHTVIPQCFSNILVEDYTQHTQVKSTEISLKHRL